ncbi:MAG: hypothetical protein U0W24_03455 [Bacteroidales bacterium]
MNSVKLKIRSFGFSPLLAILPIVFIFFNLFVYKDMGTYSISCIDPQYAYLFNGLNLANGNLEIGHTDHPGTPLQVFYALVLRIVYFLSNDNNLVESVLSDPEFYLRWVALSILILNTTVFAFTGLFIQKKFNNIYLSVLFQLIPFYTFQSFFSVALIGGESVLLPLSTLLVLLSIGLVYDESPEINKSFIFKFSLITALLLTIKITAFPLIIIPLFLIGGIKNKIHFLFITAICCIILILPILPKINQFINFIEGLVSRQGLYGKGAPGIINFKMFISNLFSLFTKELTFTLSYVLILAATIKSNLQKGVREEVNPRLKKLLLSVFAAISVQILIVAKHYSFHYMVPVLSLCIPGIWISSQVFSRTWLRFNRLSNRFKNSLLMLFVLVILLRDILLFNFYPGIQNPASKTIQFLAKQKSRATVIIAERHKEAALIEQAMFFGVSYSGQAKDQYKKILAKIYPNTFFYSASEELQDWNQHYMKDELLKKFKNILLYVKYNTLASKDSFISTFLHMKVADSLFSVKEIYKNPPAHEIIAQITADTGAIQKVLIPDITIQSNLESLTQDGLKFVDSSEKYSFDKGRLVNNSVVHSGKRAILLTKENPYGLDIKINAMAGSLVKVSAWRNSDENVGLIASTSDDNKDFFKCGAYIKSRIGKWEEIVYSFYVPLDFPGNQVNIFFWNNGSGKVYLDDVRIEVYY